MTNEGEQLAHEAGGYGLVSRAVGGLPIVNHVLHRLGPSGLLGEALGEVDGRTKLAPAAAIGLVVTNLVLGREPLYALGEWAARFDPALLGLSEAEVGAINDDRVGRALDALFDADRASLLTARRRHLGALACSSMATQGNWSIAVVRPRRGARYSGGVASARDDVRRPAGRPTSVIDAVQVSWHLYVVVLRPASRPASAIPDR